MKSMRGLPLEEFLKEIDNPPPPKYRAGDILYSHAMFSGEIEVIEIIGSYYHGKIEGEITAEDIQGSIPTFYKFKWLHPNSSTPNGANRLTGMNIYGVDNDWFPFNKETAGETHELWKLLFK